MILQCGQYVLGRTTLCKLAIAMIANHLNGTFHVGLVLHKRFAQVHLLTSGLQDFGLEERKGRVVPARTRTVLVLHACDGNLLDDGKLGFVALRRVFGFVSLYTDGHESQQCES